MDRISPENRSLLMSKVHGKDTKIEILLRRALWRKGLRYRKNLNVGGIKVDLAFKKHGLVVFVDGCFWHGCPLHYTPPSSRESFWSNKLKDNIHRDMRQTHELESLGWKVIRIWEHTVINDIESAVSEITSYCNTDINIYD